MMGLKWASLVILLIEQGMIIEGELNQIASQKCLNPFDYSSFMASWRYASLRGSGEGGTWLKGRFCHGISRLIGVDRRWFLS